MINRASFYKVIRTKLFDGHILSAEVSGMEYILNYWEDRPNAYSDIRWLAYMFATVFHETAMTMQPIEEYGKGKGRKYGSKIKRSGVRYSLPDKIYYGRGLVQLTWYENYELMSRLLFNDKRLLVEPELVLDPKVSTSIMFEGMLKSSSSFGDFTGKCLEMYFNDEKDDPKNARRIINGTDKARTIAGYHNIFLEALKA